SRPMRGIELPKAAHLDKTPSAFSTRNRQANQLFGKFMLKGAQQLKTICSFASHFLPKMFKK
ncbi:MAG TPA: hypothetical protein PK971_12790, partial [Saprospiraceae bacterium]|nr:hypothetical protein [Saprospiraceae bacterium]